MNSEEEKKCRPIREPNQAFTWPDPTPEMLDTPEFEAVWNVIKGWDISVLEKDDGLYTGGTGNHVRAILDALPMGTGLLGLIRETHETAASHGFWPTVPPDEMRPGEIHDLASEAGKEPPFRCGVRNLGELLFLICTELSEGYDGWRKDVPIDDPKKGMLVELADATIRIFVEPDHTEADNVNI